MDYWRPLFTRSFLQTMFTEVIKTGNAVYQITEDPRFLPAATWEVRGGTADPFAGDTGWNTTPRTGGWWAATWRRRPSCT